MNAKRSNKFMSFIVLAGVLVVAACQPKAAAPGQLPTAAPATDLTDHQVLTIGIVSADPAKTIEGFQPFIDYLAKQLSDLGIQEGRVVVTPDFDTMNEKLKTGEVDLFYETAYGALYAYQGAGAEPLARLEKRAGRVSQHFFCEER